MLVYRLCKKEEITSILNFKNFSQVGKCLAKNRKLNTNSYNKNIKYLHFFKYKGDLLYLTLNADTYICTYDIPCYILELHKGIGFYLDFYNFEKITNVDEYAIPIDQLHFSNLCKVEKIINYMDIDDFLYDFNKNVEVIYSNNNVLKYLTTLANVDNVMKLYNILMSDDIELQINNNFEQLCQLIPELNNIVGFEHKHPHHHLNVWQHTLYALSLSVQDFDIRLALLLHDIGKPFSYFEQDGIRHFPNHPEISFKISQNILKRLGFNDKYIEKIGYLIRYHDKKISLEEINNNQKLMYSLYLVQKCDALAHNPEKLTKRKEYLKTTRKLILKKIKKINTLK